MHNNVEIISFDVEGTLVTTEFSAAIWFEMIPELFADRYGIEFNEAINQVRQAYDSVGDQRLEWYDVQYWFDRFDLGRADIAMERFQSKVRYYPEVIEVLDRLSDHYKLTIASGSPRPFLKHLLHDIEHYFTAIFSSVSDFKQIKTADFYLTICSILGVNPNQIVHIGDNLQFDFNEPSRAGITAFHLDREHNTGNPASLNNLSQLSNLLL